MSQVGLQNILGEPLHTHAHVHSLYSLPFCMIHTCTCTRTLTLLIAFLQLSWSASSTPPPPPLIDMCVCVVVFNAMMEHTCRSQHHVITCLCMWITFTLLLSRMHFVDLWVYVRSTTTIDGVRRQRYPCIVCYCMCAVIFNTADDGTHLCLYRPR